MTNEEKMLKIAEKLAEKTAKENAVKAEYKEKAKVKALTTSERLDRIEKILGIV